MPNPTHNLTADVQSKSQVKPDNKTTERPRNTSENYANRPKIAHTAIPNAAPGPARMDLQAIDREVLRRNKSNARFKGHSCPAVVQGWCTRAELKKQKNVSSLTGSPPFLAVTTVSGRKIRDIYRHNRDGSNHP